MSRADDMKRVRAWCVDHGVACSNLTSIATLIAAVRAETFESAAEWVEGHHQGCERDEYAALIRALAKESAK